MKKIISDKVESIPLDSLSGSHFDSYNFGVIEDGKAFILCYDSHHKKYYWKRFERLNTHNSYQLCFYKNYDDVISALRLWLEGDDHIKNNVSIYMDRSLTSLIVGMSNYFSV